MLCHFHYSDSDTPTVTIKKNCQQTINIWTYFVFVSCALKRKQQQQRNGEISYKRFDLKCTTKILLKFITWLFDRIGSLHGLKSNKKVSHTHNSGSSPM